MSLFRRKFSALHAIIIEGNLSFMCHYFVEEISALLADDTGKAGISST
jgi:hypothetical protein